ncbi:hypothetical protein HW130_14090 [Streptomyces sp. PKU-EA00015]|uniref:hypothetical protein n=1 Tax=Streptomyces sp. PKU-EA00015 TaxID=2748326 RepID=UPI0015A03D7F|nr:hypothetical protein [Streptomyces sp. PKU-EA00015]NWF27387.1 hypothetical protein [Streptomyces sp. PKU-EA00015]
MSNDDQRSPTPDTAPRTDSVAGRIVHWLVTGCLLLAGLAYVAHQHPAVGAALQAAFSGGALLMTAVLAATRR